MRSVLDPHALAIPGVRNLRNKPTILAELDRGADENRLRKIPGFTLPVQFYEGARQARFFCGERRLMLALLADAVCCLLTLGRRYERSRKEARGWLAGRGRSPISFEDACEALGLNPDRTRVSIEHLVAGERGAALRTLIGRSPYRR